nr:MAG TPA: hypothetical protein [Bacteriophage sp.]
MLSISILYESYVIRSIMASARVLSPPQICWYHSLSRNCEQKIVDDFLRLLCISSKRFLASASVSLRRRHSSMISTTGWCTSSGQLKKFRCLWQPVSPVINQEAAHTVLCSSVCRPLHAKSTGHISFTTSGGTCNEDVPVFCNVFASCQTADQCFVQFPTGLVINCCNAGIRLFELSLPDQSFQPVIFAIAVLDINKHTEAVLERHFLHCRIIHLDTECICHSGQAHFDKFIDCTLICHDRLPP